MDKKVAILLTQQCEDLIDMLSLHDIDLSNEQNEKLYIYLLELLSYSKSMIHLYSCKLFSAIYSITRDALEVYVYLRLILDNYNSNEIQEVLNYINVKDIYQKLEIYYNSDSRSELERQNYWNDEILKQINKLFGPSNSITSNNDKAKNLNELKRQYANLQNSKLFPFGKGKGELIVEAVSSNRKYIKVFGSSPQNITDLYNILCSYTHSNFTSAKYKHIDATGSIKFDPWNKDIDQCLTIIAWCVADVNALCRSLLPDNVSDKN